MNKKLMLWILPIILLLSIVGASASLDISFLLPASEATVANSFVNVTIRSADAVIMGANLSMSYLNNTQIWANASSKNYTAGMGNLSITFPSNSFEDGKMTITARVTLQNGTVGNSTARTIYIDNLNPVLSYSTAPEDKTDQSSNSVAFIITSDEGLTSAYIDFGAGKTKQMISDNSMNKQWSGTITSIPRGTYTFNVIGFEEGINGTSSGTANRQITISDKTGLVLDEQGQVVQPGVSTPTGGNGAVIGIVIFVILIILSQWKKK